MKLVLVGNLKTPINLRQEEETFDIDTKAFARALLPSSKPKLLLCASLEIQVDSFDAEDWGVIGDKKVRVTVELIGGSDDIA